MLRPCNARLHEAYTGYAWRDRTVATVSASSAVLSSR